MTIQTSNTIIDHTTDAGFRTWASEMDSQFIAMGWTATADTGQINFTTVLRPTSNTEGGYKMYNLGGTPTLYAKIGFGTSSSANIPTIWLTLGTGTNLAGTITGTQTSRLQLNTAATLSASTAYITRMSHVAGLSTNVEFKGNATVSSYGPVALFSISRTVDDTGAATSDGLFLIYRSTSSALFFTYLDFVTTTFTTFPTNNSFCFIPGGVASSIVGTTPQIFRHYGPTPRMRPLIGSCTMISAEASEGSTFTTKPVGNTTTRTFVATSVIQGSINSPSTTRICFMYE